MRARLAACAILAAAAPPLGYAESVWIEAEEPAATNFPPAAENPFAPKVFWEEDLLSAGRWVGMLWKVGEDAQPFLEYEFETRSPGGFSLYARKFYTYGNFRWRVDDGPWHEVPNTLHEELDSVAMRDSPEEIISLTWHYMGRVSLEPGRHRLRIEPLPGKMPTPREGAKPLAGYPLAYDAFLLTSEAFSPAGKLKPGEKFETRAVNGFAFQAPADPFAPSPVDWRHLNEAFAGERGGITVRDGRLVYRKDGGEARLLGVNTRPGLYAAPDTSAYLARLLAKKGVNLARFDIGYVLRVERAGDGAPVLVVDQPLLDAMLQLIADFKAQGISAALAWNFSNTRGLAEFLNLPAGPDAIAGYETSPHVLFDPGIQDLVRKGWREVLLGRLPGADTPLARDPALALLTLGQQLSAFAGAAAGGPPAEGNIPAAREAAFRGWLAKKHGSLEAAVAAWEKADGERFSGADEFLPPPAEIARGGKARAREAAQFLAQAERSWLEGLARSLRDATGYPGLVSFSNRPTEFPETLGLAAAWAGLGGDVTERIGLFVAPYEAPDNIWVVAAGGKFRDRSALRFDPLGVAQASRYDLPLRALRYGDKPAILTEAGWTAPNRFRGEGPLLAALLASMQDAQLLAFQGLLGFDWHKSLPTSRVPFLTPATLGQFPAIAFAYRGGLLPGPFISATWQIPEERFFSLKPAAVAEMREERVRQPETTAGEPAAPAARIPSALYLAGAVRVETASGEERLVIEEAAEKSFAGEAMELGRGSVLWDDARGLLLVKAPQFEAVAGFLRQAGPRRAGVLDLRSEMDFGVVCLVSLDGKPLDFSSKMLLQVFSEEQNAGEFIEEGEPRVLRSIGRPPLLLRPMEGRVALNRPDAREILATALDANGYPVLPAGSARDLQLLPATLYYLLEK